MEERYGFEGMCNKRLRWGYTRRIDFNVRIFGRKFSSKCGAILIIKYFTNISDNNRKTAQCYYLLL